MTQYFEMFGHRAIYHDGWRAVCPWPAAELHRGGQAGRRFGDADHAGGPRRAGPQRVGAVPHRRRPDRARNVAAEHPEKLRELIARWWAEAGKYKVLPLDGSAQARLATVRPQTAKPRTRYVYYPGGSVVPAFAAPLIFNRPYSIEADVEIPAGGAEGVLVAQGGDAGG